MAVTQISDKPLYQANKPKEFNNAMDKDSFLNLLVTQLRNQNPLQPLDDKDFIAQMAQFSALEQAQNSNQSIRANSAYNIVNKFVTANHKDANSGNYTEISGLARKVRVDGDKLYLTLETSKDGKTVDEEVLYDEVSEVEDTVSLLDQTLIMNQNLKLSSAYNMIGKDVKAMHYDATTKKTTEVSGKVEKLKVDSSKVFVVINGTNVPVEEVFEVNGATT